MHSITWYDMVKWCNARSQKEGLTPCYTVSGSTCKTGESDAVVCNWSASGYRLPTEAEWEKAARGGVTGKNFPWGDTINHSNANYRANGSAFSYDTSGYTSYTYHPTYAVGGYPYSSPVGSFAPNGYGLYGMAGNMSERCWDWYGSYSSGSQTDPRGAATGSDRVIRGGSWDRSAGGTRCAYRTATGPTAPTATTDSAWPEVSPNSKQAMNKQPASEQSRARGGAEGRSPGVSDGGLGGGFRMSEDEKSGGVKGRSP